MNIHKDTLMSSLIFLAPFWLVIPLLMAVIFLVTIMKHGFPLGIFSIGFMAIGLIFFVVSKISVIGKSKWISFESKEMKKGYRILYKIGYLLMIIGIFTSIVFINIEVRSSG